MKRTTLWIGSLMTVVIVGLVVLQVVAARDMTNPPVLQEPAWDSPATRQLAVRACYACHSNETNWPWYSYVPGVSLVLAQHVREGRDYLNFSEWVPGRKQSGESAETIRDGSMPPGYYTFMHPTARLTQEEMQRLAEELSALSGERSDEGEAGESERGSS